MSKADTETVGVTDADIEAIVAQGEAGIGDLMAAYEPVESQYFSSVQASAPSITYSIDTNQR